jgi:putative ABC transport system ATP-binding protein
MTVTIPKARTGTELTVIAARAVGLTKVYGEEDSAVLALDNVTVDFARSQFTAIMGPSGSGKSTLLHCLAGLDTPTSGSIWLGDTEITALNDRDLTLLRRNRVGFIFQAFNLLPTLTAAQNITLPLDIAGRKADNDWADRVVETMGIADRLSHRPAELSGGQQQRVAAARALTTKPDVVFADEPTGALDSHSAGELLGFLQQATHEFKQTIVMVTHDATAAAYADRVVFLADGKIVDEMADPTAESVLDFMKHLGG